MANSVQNALHKVLGMARGYLVVDENVLSLAAPLEKLNMHVVIPPKGMEDANIAKMLLGGRILVTANPDDFIEQAPVFDFGIIALDKLKFIDKSQDGINNRTVKAINAAIIKHSLWSKSKAFKVTLNESGTDSSFEEIN